MCSRLYLAGESYGTFRRCDFTIIMYRMNSA